MFYSTHVKFQLLENRHLLEDQEFDVAIVDLLYNECGLALARDGILYIPSITFPRGEFFISTH